MATTTKHFGKQIIGPASDPYMVRYILFRWRNLPRVYVHKFVRSDDERAPHNHPWWFMSLVLWGSYLEYTDTPPNPHHRGWLSFGYRNLDTFHRVGLPNYFRRDGTYGPKPCWTICVTGPDVRGWGFRCWEKLNDAVRSHDPWCRYPRLNCTCTKSRRQEVPVVVPWDQFAGCGE